MSPKEKIGCAILGVRGYAGVLINKILQSGLYDLRWCIHPQIEVAQENARKHGARGSSDLETCLKDDKVKALFIATPNDLHFEQAIAGLRAQKHIFVEKPMTESLEQADKIRSILRSSSKVFMVGHNYRRKNGIRQIKRMLQEGILGVPVSMEFINSHGGAFNMSAEQWRAKDERCPLLPLTMLGTHSFDTAEYLFGRARSVFVRAAHRCAPLPVIDSTSCSLLMDNGVQAYFSHQYNVPSCAYIQVHGSEGSVRYDIDEPFLIHRTGRDRDRMPAENRKIDLDPIDDRLEQIVEFAQAIHGEGQVETGFNQGWRAVAFLSAASVSVQSGRDTSIPILTGE
jgi:predicted dehydrogenase